MVENQASFTVLLVDKDLDALTLLQKSLSGNSEFPAQIDHVADEKEALLRLKNHSYHLLLMESELQDEGAFRFFDEVQNLKLDFPFVLMTSVRDDVLVRKAIQHGVADLIVKSESHFNELGEKLRQCYDKFCSAHPRKENRRVEGAEMPRFAAEPNSGISNRDDLTGLYNHSYLYERVVQEFSKAVRYKYPLSCIMVNIDHFKAVNEKCGYRAGDALLKECAALLFENCRLSDLLARHSGEEFAILMPHVDYRGAQELADRLRVVFAEQKFGNLAEEINLTISIGISSYPDDSMERRSELIAYASQALSRSKAAGRNRVTLYKEIVPMFGAELPVLRISEEKVIEFQRKLSEISDTARRMTIDASKALIIALETKDRFTAGHAASCAKYSMQIAEAMGLSVDEAEVVEHAALLHDIGKICIPDSILLKPARLSLSEFESMKQHPYLGYKILKPIKFLQQEAVLVLHHHEWYNGEGYPCRLKGNEIPLGARIISIIDSYDTMRIAGGRYKKTCTAEAAVQELINCSGVQFDPFVVKAFIDVLKTRKELLTDDYDMAKLEKAMLAAQPNKAA